MKSGIRGRNTRPELIVRRALFAAGYRFRLHRSGLPGRSDVVMQARKVALRSIPILSSCSDIICFADVSYRPRTPSEITLCDVPERRNARPASR